MAKLEPVLLPLPNLSRNLRCSTASSDLWPHVLETRAKRGAELSAIHHLVISWLQVGDAGQTQQSQVYREGLLETPVRSFNSHCCLSGKAEEELQPDQPTLQQWCSWEPPVTWPHRAFQSPPQLRPSATIRQAGLRWPAESPAKHVLRPGNY